MKLKYMWMNLWLWLVYWPDPAPQIEYRAPPVVELGPALQVDEDGQVIRPDETNEVKH